MRNVFLALLLANLLFVAWQQWGAAPAVAPARLFPVGEEKRLEVMSREPAAGGVEPSSGPRFAETLVVPPGGICMRVGPISEGATADVVRLRLTEAGLDVTMMAEDGQIWVGYWIQLPSVPTRGEADGLLARLAAGGLPDAYVVQTTPPFSISLGVFRDRERAETVVQKAKRMGFFPKISDRYRTGQQYWIFVVMPSGRSLPAGALSTADGKGVRAEQVRCPAVAWVGSPPRGLI